MKVAILASYPIYPYATELGVDAKAQKRVTTFNLSLVESLVKYTDLDIHVITGGPSSVLSSTRTVHRKNLTVTFLRYPRIVNGVTLYHCNRLVAHRMLKNIRPDIVHGIGTEHIWPYIAVTSHFPSVITVHGIMTEVVRKLSPPLISLHRYFSILERITLRKARHVISTIRPYTENMIGPYTNATLYSVENAIPDRFWQASTNPHSGQNILFVGDLGERKSVLTLIQAFHQLRDAGQLRGMKLIIIGPITNSPYSKQVQDCLEANQLLQQVKLRGFMLPEELVKEYPAASMLVLPSKQETAPLSISEAMAAGLPVIASRVSGIPQMVEDGVSGYLFEVGKVDELASQMKKLIDDPDLRTSMGCWGKKIAEKRWKPELVAQKTLEVYQQVIAD